MYKKVNKLTENHLRVLELFTRGYDKEYYIREVQKLLKISSRTAQLVLADLEAKAVLESRTRGKIKTYKIRPSIISKEYFMLAESYKLIKFLERDVLVKEVIDKLLPSIKGIALVFGSYAKGTQKKGSDLDIFIAGSYDKKKAKEISKLYGINISIKRYPMNIFKKKLMTDVLLKEVVGYHVIIKGAEEFISKVIAWRK